MAEADPLAKHSATGSHQVHAMQQGQLGGRVEGETGCGGWKGVFWAPWGALDSPGPSCCHLICTMGRRVPVLTQAAPFSCLLSLESLKGITRAGGHPGRALRAGNPCSFPGGEPSQWASCTSLLQAAINCVSSAHDRERLWQSYAWLVVQLQARMRGFLVRHHWAARQRFLSQQVPAATKIQVGAAAPLQREGLPQPGVL